MADRIRSSPRNAQLAVAKWGVGDLGGSAASDAGALGFAANGFADGGFVSGPGTGTSDSIPAMLSHGEYVVSAAPAARHAPLLHAINSGKVPRIAFGGFVGGNLFAALTNSAPSQAAPVHNNQRSISQTVHLHAKDADGVRKSASQVSAALSHGLSQAAARWR